MDRYDWAELACLAAFVAFFGFLWPPLMLLVGSLLGVVWVNLREREAAAVRRTRRRLADAARAARASLRETKEQQAA